MAGSTAAGDASAPSRDIVDPAFTSRPAQKHPPAPIRITARTSEAASTSRHASAMPSHISTSRALSRSGLLSVMVPTGPLTSTCTFSVIAISTSRVDWDS